MDDAIALALALTCRKRRTSKKKRTKWSKQWFLNRAKFGHSELLKELRNNEPDDYKNFLRMDGDCFNELLEMVMTTTTTTANQLYHNSFTMVLLSNSNANGYGNTDSNTNTKDSTNDSTNANTNANGSLLN
ncbi:hypothetical protein PoB_004025800 [Plakobranchus ocellatus]|uniref:Uncharacterized protein n=1 Tax=Plakobranchus ocellatus TaxID=259542 RepID=A0AAV4B4R0_9GAST|nr:hypothetical protein PoB_004025800 [Plakobranchus ocellatus]